MSLPDMGLIISTSLNMMVVLIPNTLCLTFTLLKSKPPPEFSSRVIVEISIVDAIHFIGVCLLFNK
ncbi:hypothetical protein Scep_001422 [Stephania cephalantha]|uniref:Uncharacterized protein n=1 Tax=Stephania cephalantha TaxID=152367 RepID=A0AAP0L8D0_9MAGN